MAYQIEYAYTCHVGNVRANNEDNFWCCGKSLDAENHGTEGVLTGCASQSDFPLLAVFDGMGGESCGEMAAYLAADSCGKFYEKNRYEIGKEPTVFLQQSCSSMNHAVCLYSEENKIRSMGTTAAMITFCEDAVYTCNLGDSRIYQYQDGKIRQISTDHVLKGTMFGKAPLTQYVGFQEDFMEPEPSIGKNGYGAGIRYLLCSDGVTDMMSDEEIADILTQEKTVKEAVEDLLDQALRKGGRDNVTIILCEIAEQGRLTWLEQWRKRFGRKRGDAK